MNSYDKYIVAFSGGKDSMACFLHLLEIGIPKYKIELWHHDIDGGEGEEHFFDWPITKDYCKKFAQAFGVEIYFSWKEGGFKRELLRENQRTAPIFTETPDQGIISKGGNRGKLTTRRKFPQISPDLSVRWCSAYLKIDVCAAAIRMQPRFEGIKTLIISGERGEESPARAKYSMHEIDRSDNRGGQKVDRFVDRWRPIRDWTENQVWDIIEKYNVRVHPCYYLGYSRCSCMHCIFGNKDQFATSAFIDPMGMGDIINLESDFGVTLKRNKDLQTLIDSGTVYEDTLGNPVLIDIVMSHVYDLPIIMEEGTWHIPSGAYGESCGPV